METKGTRETIARCQPRAKSENGIPRRQVSIGVHEPCSIAAAARSAGARARAARERGAGPAIDVGRPWPRRGRPLQPPLCNCLGALPRRAQPPSHHVPYYVTRPATSLDWTANVIP
ncbi:hypothetical protein EVAR_54645_1 [Eumeta japonica]|uniref:Uncharacterized protein n=1 Tax=Eumeta variegata TaxID=151549 RepID=A0A4C1X836_EUMVA|nr:hypothetical protein EVAR_54645_1 [Eumeta japonica]